MQMWPCSINIDERSEEGWSGNFSACDDACEESGEFSMLGSPRLRAAPDGGRRSAQSVVNTFYYAVDNII